MDAWDWNGLLAFLILAAALMGAALGRGRVGRLAYAARLLLTIAVFPLSVWISPPQISALNLASLFAPMTLATALALLELLAKLALIGCLFAWSACRLNDIGLSRWHALHAAAPLALEFFAPETIGPVLAFSFLALFAALLALAPSRWVRESEATVETFR